MHGWLCAEQRGWGTGHGVHSYFYNLSALTAARDWLQPRQIDAVRLVVACRSAAALDPKPAKQHHQLVGSGRASAPTPKPGARKVVALVVYFGRGLLPRGACLIRAPSQSTKPRVVCPQPPSTSDIHAASPQSPLATVL